MVTAGLTGWSHTAVASAPALAKLGAGAVGIVELVVIFGWVLIFVVLLGYLALVMTVRGRAQRRAPAGWPARPRAGLLPDGLGALRKADPDFDEEVLLDAAQTATLLIFVAICTGDEAPLSRLVTSSFWLQPLGRLVQLTARDRRRERGRRAKDGASGANRGWRSVPLDYQATIPELVAIRLGADQRVCVRAAFDQLQALVHPRASETSGPRVRGLSWLSGGGHYELTFVRPAGARTDPAAVLSCRTCTRCGATYRSEMATACAHCGSPRPVPWGRWRLAQAVPVM